MNSFLSSRVSYSCQNTLSIHTNLFTESMATGMNWFDSDILLIKCNSMYICVSKDKCYFGSNYFCISMLYSCNGTDILECLVIDTFIGFLILYAEYIINGFQVGMRAASYETLLFLLEISFKTKFSLSIFHSRWIPIVHANYKIPMPFKLSKVVSSYSDCGRV